MLFRNPPVGAFRGTKPKKAEKKNTDIFGDSPLPRTPRATDPADHDGLADT